MKTFEQLVKTIVEGQIRSFINDHPEVLTEWRGTGAEGLKNSIAKRILGDLTCETTIERLKLALSD